MCVCVWWKSLNLSAAILSSFALSQTLRQWSLVMFSSLIPTLHWLIYWLRLYKKTQKTIHAFQDSVTHVLHDWNPLIHKIKLCGFCVYSHIHHNSCAFKVGMICIIWPSFLAWHLCCGAGGNSDSVFDVAKTVGTIIIAKPLDAEQCSFYNMTVQATDGTNTAYTQVPLFLYFSIAYSLVHFNWFCSTVLCQNVEKISKCGLYCLLKLENIHQIGIGTYDQIDKNHV